MNIVETPINDLFVIEPDVFADSRGYFFECYNHEKFAKLGINTKFIQDNESLSEYGVIRGLHFQLAPYSQAKLVRVVKGKVLDVAVDIRKNSPTFGKHFSIELDEHEKKMLYIPRGFAHGFSVLSEYAIFQYKCDALYNADSERGILYNDPCFSIDWKVDADKAKVSAKDNVWPLFENVEANFVYGGQY